MRKYTFLAGIAALSLLLGGCGPSKESLKSSGQVLATRRDGNSPSNDPLDPAWGKSHVYSSPMKMQDIVEPRMSEPGVASVDVRAVYDEKELVIRLDWPDSTADTVAFPAKFGDAIAIEFPLASGTTVPDANMGQEGGKVQIYQWKAFWQTKAGLTKSLTKTLYPNSYIDYYPPEAAKDSSSRDLLEKQYAPAWNAGNPVAHRTGSAQAYVAEGFGSLTALHQSMVEGKGIWKDGRWYVALTLDLSQVSSDSPLKPNERTFIALAVWDGSSQNVGARKMRTTWTPFLMSQVAK
ncbi:hypothetical protein IT157_04520 [bacterium]|nr:hypothetical protein [bacterium]